MPQYFFHLRDGKDTLLDPEGSELSGIEAARHQALTEARSLISQEALAGVIKLDQRIEVEDDFGNLVHRLEFVDAVEIRTPPAG